MKILVCISKTPDTTAKIAFTDNNTKFDTNGVQWIINPYDEWYSLVRAIELKEADASTVIHLITVGTPDADPIIRKALALGGDEAIRVNADSHDSFYIASQIAEIAKQGAYDLIFTGKETIDFNGSSIGHSLHSSKSCLRHFHTCGYMVVESKKNSWFRSFSKNKSAATCNGIAAGSIRYSRSILCCGCKSVSLVRRGSPVCCNAVFTFINMDALYYPE